MFHAKLAKENRKDWKQFMNWRIYPDNFEWQGEVRDLSLTVSDFEFLVRSSFSYELEILADFYLTTENAERVTESRRENPLDLNNLELGIEESGIINSCEWGSFELLVENPCGFMLTAKNAERVAKSRRGNPLDFRKIEGFILKILNTKVRSGIYPWRYKILSF